MIFSFVQCAGISHLKWNSIDIWKFDVFSNDQGGIYIQMSYQYDLPK